MRRKYCPDTYDAANLTAATIIVADGRYSGLMLTWAEQIVAADEPAEQAKTPLFVASEAA